MLIARVLCAIGLALALVSGCTSGQQGPASKVGAVADSGFRPQVDGFPFQNYGEVLASGARPTDLTPADVRQVFGDAVCADAAIGRCDLIPEAEMWMHAMNEQMADGHCFGFSVAAGLLYHEKYDARKLGAPTVEQLAIDGNTDLQTTLARDWTYQTLDAVQERKITGTPTEILHHLEKVLRPDAADTYTLGLWKRDGTGGHAVTPYRVDYEGDGKYQVLIYDNNWPGETRAIAVDAGKDTWSYLATTNPNDPTRLYDGDAETQTLALFPTSPALKTQPCPFCAKRQGPQGPATGTAGALGGGTTEILLSASRTHHAHVIVTDDAGRRLGYVHGRVVNEIPGAHYVDPTGDGDWQTKLEPILFVPADAVYTVTIDATELDRPDTESIEIIGPSWDVAVEAIPVGPGDKDVLTVHPRATKLTYRTTRAQSPTIELGISETNAEYAFVLSGETEQPGSVLTLDIPRDGGRLVLDNVGATAASRVDLQVTRETPRGVQRFRHRGISLAGNEPAELIFGQAVEGPVTVRLATSHNGRSTVQPLTNEP